MNVKQMNKGFTIIEVVLVLAIAGLIFLMVFIALPALQAGQRDSARKSDVGIVASAVNSYIANNRGSAPTSTSLASYAKNVSSNTTGIEVIGYATPVSVDDGQIKVVMGAKCSAAGTSDTTATYTLTAGTTRQYVVVTRLEGGNGSAFCQDS
jgi:prepilin-type N-terminal cleavage/methylation domain-containing protein